MRLSPQGIAFIARFEGYRARAYNDQGGNATIGVGHLLHMGPVTWQDKLRFWTRRHALLVLQKDAARADAAVSAYARRDLTQAQHDALASFAYNCGAGALHSSSLLRLVNERGPAQEIKAAFLEWDHVGQNVSAGLLTRREAEAMLYLTARYV